MTNEIMKYLKKTGESYKLQVEDVVVEIQYSENHKKFNECMLNILNRKMRLDHESIS